MLLVAPAISETMSKIAVQPGDEVIDSHAVVYKVEFVDQQGNFIAVKPYNLESYHFDADGVRKDNLDPTANVQLHRLAVYVPVVEIPQGNNMDLPPPIISITAVVTNPED